MKRGEFYRVSLGSKTDTKRQRVYVIVSRQELIDSGYSTLICAPVYTNYEGLSTQVQVGVDDCLRGVQSTPRQIPYQNNNPDRVVEGLKHPSAIRCDELISILKSQLTDYIGILSVEKFFELGQALSIALGID